MELYRQSDYERTKKTLALHVAVAAVILLAFVALLAMFVSVCRNLSLAMLSCALGGALLTFYAVIKVMPWFSYWRYQVDIRRGRAHELDCRFVSASDGERVSDGVAFHEFIVALDEESQDERLLFWDADKAMPPLNPGQTLHIRLFGNYIIALDAN